MGPLGHLLHVSPVSTRLPFLLCKEGYLHGNLLQDSEQEGDVVVRRKEIWRWDHHHYLMKNMVDAHAFPFRVGAGPFRFTPR